jgi:hypothetical protein
VVLFDDAGGELTVSRGPDETLAVELVVPDACSEGGALCRGVRLTGAPVCDRFDVWLEYVADPDADDASESDSWIADLIDLFEGPAGWVGSVDARCLVPGEGTLVIEAAWEGC